jgi:hypothetical protein
MKMRKIILLVYILFSFAFGAVAQLYKFPQPGFKQGEYFYDGFTGTTQTTYYQDWSFFYVKDTVVSSIKYNSFLQASKGKFYTRYDSGKVYMAGTLGNTSTDQLWFDFSLKVNDTISINKGGFGVNGLYTVYSTSMITCANGQKRKLMRLHNSISDTITWIYGIGDIKNGFFEQSSWEGAREFFVCSHDSTGLVYGVSDSLYDCDSMEYISPNTGGNQCSVSVTSINALCYGSCNGSATATATSGTAPDSYFWSPEGAIGQTISDLCAGTYTVTLTDKTGCTSSTTVTITQPALLTVQTSSPVSSTCYGTCDGTITVAASGGVPNYTYSWSNGVPEASNHEMCSGTYTVIVTDAYGCTNFSTCTIMSLPQINVTTSSTPAIGSGVNNGTASAEVTGGTPGYAYLWSPIAATSQTVSYLPCGIYSVFVTDSSGCTATAVDTVNCLLDINEFRNDFSFNIFPNPTSTNITIESSTANPVQITLLNLLGQTVSHPDPPVSSSYLIDVGDLPKAIYIVQVTDKVTGNVGRQKIVVQ